MNQTGVPTWLGFWLGEGSLVKAGRANEYNFTIRWSQFLQIIVPDDDYSQFMIYGERKWITLN